MLFFLHKFPWHCNFCGERASDSCPISVVRSCGAFAGRQHFPAGKETSRQSHLCQVLHLCRNLSALSSLFQFKTFIWNDIFSQWKKKRKKNEIFWVSVQVQGMTHLKTFQDIGRPDILIQAWKHPCVENFNVNTFLQNGFDYFGTGAFHFFQNPQNC